MRNVLSGYFLYKLRLPLAIVTISITFYMQVVPLVTATNNRIKGGGEGTLYLWYSPINLDPGLGITDNVTSSTFTHRHLYRLYVIYAIMTLCTVYLLDTVVLWFYGNKTIFH